MNIPAWQLKTEGRMLELPNQRSKDKGPPRKFSTLIKRPVVELDRDPKSYPESNNVEWPRATGSHNPVMDGFTVRRMGDIPTSIRIVLYLDHYPEQYKVAPGPAGSGAHSPSWSPSDPSLTVEHPQPSSNGKKRKCLEILTSFYAEPSSPVTYWIAALDVFETGENLPTRTHGLAIFDAPEDWRMALVWGRTLTNSHAESSTCRTPHKEAVENLGEGGTCTAPSEAGEKYWAGPTDPVLSWMQMEDAEVGMNKEVEFSRGRRCLIVGGAIAESLDEALERGEGIWFVRLKRRGFFDKARRAKKEKPEMGEETRKRKREVDDGDGDGNCCCKPRSKAPRSPTSPSLLSCTCPPPPSLSASSASSSASPPSIIPQSPSSSQDEDPGDEDEI
ncbi:SWI/SNF and RSC complex subunit Ssr3 [Marasmius crinis-equi]|uniref:SWI/SNF and RSC complex subunit Ssr3 n=1 Tax=Marasmius crinis-equi TaxID=585013 RepID=A0ABR3EV19_9AGAR